ncbi:ras-related protein Rab-1A [Biomphalaria glabrata]|uniref:Ras-related protein Rab-1A-like n=2 Tax=Biomphalaria glabrata TaxID=6526 RepID=A0A9W2ZDH3_BIOGL|nr:ras-related protein Rab-1A-like [Biomphalaria glabrata]XP_055873125.1 ras-related protein Rab-1A-like [Biomphalaria glabrata]XP_055873126.1 ras-related protein Rab-1A-like [Biomphalaria glabrata]XP_055873127.1 ras-related protein Rab-1A-like [Biomphalaria glabrata]XP_055873128.1 ras-related protein Rab-1A-like [Biomphalaria glabrata]KAI8752047.1 ras-related protein Rab-1A-like; partial [Biomphalaria glabrata]
MPIAEKECAVTYKVLLVGDRSVGKTALLRSLSSQEFKEKSLPTVGPDFINRIFEVDGALVRLQIWDSPGHERLRSMTRQQYSGIHGLALVYDVTDELSFESVGYWIRSLNVDTDHKKVNYKPTPVILIGNKTDLISGKIVSSSRAEQFAEKELLFGLYETSAKTGDNVLAAFHKLAYHITELQNPMFMTSYHPFLIRRTSKILSNQTQTCDPPKRFSKSKKKTKENKPKRSNSTPHKSKPTDTQNKLNNKPATHQTAQINQTNGSATTKSDRPRAQRSCLLFACFRPKKEE